IAVRHRVAESMHFTVARSIAPRDPTPLAYNIFPFAKRPLLLRAYAWHVEISDGHTVIAHHARLYGRDGEQLDPLHYLSLLERKPGGFALARPIQQWENEWPPIYHDYLAALRRARPESATREFVRILQLHARHEPAAIAAALARALALGCWSADGVAYCLADTTIPAVVPGTFDLAADSRLAPLAAVQIPLPDLRAFNRLLWEEDR
ncbi:MAG: hypothetical protein ACYDAR_00285, partial [Thermomicrobiales bacterium]